MRELVDLAARVADLERRANAMVRHGTVSDVDPAKWLVRLRIGGTDDDPMKSPWVPYGQIAGALKVHTPPSVGQQMTLLAPTGDYRQAVALPMTWSDANPSPSQSGSEQVITFGSARITIKADSVVVSVGDHSVTISAAGTEYTGGAIRHDGHLIDKTHRHQEVVKGSDLSGMPP